MKYTCLKTKNLFDCLYQYEERLKQIHGEKTRTIFGKAKTALVRYTAPGWGYPIKLEGRLTPAEMLQGLEFLKTITLEQAVQALAVQESVFERFGSAVSSQSRRVYRSALKQFWNFLQTVPEWPQQSSGGGHQDSATPYIQGPRNPKGIRYALKPSEMTPQLEAELAQYRLCCRQDRTETLSKISLDTYCQNIRNLWGWLYRYKGLPLEELSLFRIVPPEAFWQPNAMERVMGLCQAYITWLRDERQVANNTLVSQLKTFFLITEYTHYVYQCQSADVSCSQEFDTSAADSGAARIPSLFGPLR